MLKNKEVTIHLLLSCCGIIFGFCLLFLFPLHTITIYFLICIFLLLSNYLFVCYRYYKINKLTTYLQNFRERKNHFIMTDYEEGELSKLKSELYKLAVLLTEQSDLLLKDKTYLADSLSDISHQIKTPLTSMMVMTDLLEQDNLPIEKRKEFVIKIQKQLQRIDWLVSTLLKMSKLDAQTIQLKQETILIKDLVEKVCHCFSVQLERNRQILITEGDEATCFLGDFSWTIEAISNLIKNAMEHTPLEGTIKITYEETVLYTMLQIYNSGEPIALEDLPNIFKRFYRGKNASPDSIGIGLAFTKQIVQLQNGTISVTSNKENGTTFIIKFYKRIV